MFDNAIKPHPEANGAPINGKLMKVLLIKMTDFIEFPLKQQEIGR